MFNTLKVAQAEKQIYPESIGQTSREKTDHSLQPTAAYLDGGGFMMSSVCRMGNGIRGSRMV